MIGGVYTWGGRFTGGFFALRVWGGGAYNWRGLYMEWLIYAILLSNNSQLCWMLHVAFVCRRCCMLLRVVVSCCAKF